MAQAQVHPIPTKMSFAKIAAMPPPATNTIPKSITKTNSTMGDRKNGYVENTTRPRSSDPSFDPKDLHNPSLSQNLPMSVELVDTAIARLALDREKANSERTADSRDSADSFEDEQSQLSTSSLNKHSFDTKSMTSVTTFAMDDPEGIRPDESASVRAADDDVPHVGLSRNSSFQQETEISQGNVKHMRHISANVTVPGRRYPTLTNPPRFGNLPVSPVLENRTTDQQPVQQIIQIDEPNESSPAVNIAPDEKLLDALASAKERLPLLQLEEKVLAFISGNAGDIMELPPQNSFARLLAHKLADYYGLAHHINEDNSSVRMFRSNSRTIPTPLSHLAKSIPVGSSQIPGSATVKIMRRANLGLRNMSAGNSTAPSSSVASKTNSENGIEINSEEGVISPGEGTPGKDKSKLTREEREAQYKAARDRIFSDFQESVTSESASTGENSASMSRSSSCNGKKKPKKQKQPKDDGFEARSAFVPSYTPVSSQFNSGFGDVSYSNMYNSSTEPFSPNMYATTPTQAFVGFDQNISYASQPGYPLHEMQPYQHGEWQPMNSPQGNFYPYHPNAAQPQPLVPPPNVMSPMPGQFAQHGVQGLPQHPNWVFNQYQNYPPPQSMPWQPYNQPTNMHPGVPSLPYGQGFGQAYNNQFVSSGNHGNSKSLFNPQTRSFVPGNNVNRVGGRGNRKKHNAVKQIGNSGSGGSSAVSGNSSPRPKEDSLQQKYGTPASLPKKPPTSEMAGGIASFGSSGQNSNNATSNGPLVVNGTGNSPA